MNVTDARRRLAELRADAFALALRFGYEGDGAAGVELVAALKEVLQACEAVQRQVGELVKEPEAMRLREERADWMRSVTAMLRDAAARVHHDAEIARRAENVRAARRLFAVKNRFEAVAAAVAGLITPRASSSSS